jgi:hypothetical protein
MAKTMTASQMTDGQIDNLTDKLRAVLRKHRSEFSTDVAQHVCGVENIGMAFLEVVYKHAESKTLLVPQGTTDITLTEDHNPDEFFQTRPGLYVWNDFHSRMTIKARPSAKSTSFKVNSFKLTKDATDKQIETALPENHLFDETTLCAVIATLVSKQPNGEDGTLLNNGYANLFYTRSCVVRVRWRSGSRLWRVGAWLRVDCGWGAGCRVFYPVN